jgi:thioredoxin reductase (NADPH)
MSQPVPPALNVSSTPDSTFPKLTPEQVARVAAHGTVRRVERGEVLIEVADHNVPFFVVKSGQIEVVRPSGTSETLVAVHGPGQFNGEVNMISGRRSLVRARVSEAGEVIEMDHAQMLSFVQLDNELGEIIMRAFILRRVNLIAQGIGDVVLLGSNHCAGTLRLREFLTRNSHPYSYVDLDADEGVQDLLDQFQVKEGDVPVLICRGELVLRNPTLQEVAECLGFNDGIDPGVIRDLVIVGGGPAGLAGAVYGASEGLDVLVIESTAPGGQAGSSSKIENYLGFPTGISGQELAARAYTQAQKFGAQVMIAQGATHLVCGRRPYALEIAEGPRVPAKTVIIASGAEYRKLALPNLSQFEGAGLYHGATFMEAQLCADEEVIVVGGGNSAGQAAVYLAQSAKKVYVLIRSGGLAESMSRYLIRRIEDHPRIELRTRTEIVAVEGEGHVERVRFRGPDGVEEERAIRHIFVMTGAAPSTGWLAGCLALDAKGFIKTGPDLTPEELADARWPLARSPYLLETSLPGVFAVGDVRSGNVKRVASAVGEGSIAVSFVHRVLAE